jgi:NAD(P)-dependent dehydrogenase (short-subunit alcohol dehydrogenase family)
MSEQKSSAALITGGTTGSGLAIALKIAKPSQIMVLNYLENDEEAADAARQVESKGAKVILVKEDVGSSEACGRVVARIARETNRIDAIVHAAATPCPGDLFEQKPDDIHRALNVNAYAMLWLVRAANAMLGEGSSVLFLSGIVGKLAVAHHGAIGISKAVAECMIRYLAIECGSRKINFNTLGYGPMDTALARTAYGRRIPMKTPYGRSLEWDDVTDVAEFLLSPKAALIRGQNVMVDGGMSVTVRKMD